MFDGFPYKACLNPFFATQAAMTCLESNEYRPVKNIFLVLNEILPVFPMKKVNAALGITLQPAVKAFLTDERDDIKVLATG